jgi:hypothetical protein
MNPFKRKAKPDKLVDYSQSNFLEWNREREMHLQMIDHLKSENNNLRSERDMWRHEAMKSVQR